MSNPTQLRLDYGRSPKRGLTRRDVRPFLLALACLGVLLTLASLPYLYTDHEWCQLAPGMTKTQIDKQLWEYRSYPFSQYQGLGPGQFVIRYELPVFGELTTIQVIYDPDGTAYDVQPAYAH